MEPIRAVSVCIFASAKASDKTVKLNCIFLVFSLNYAHIDETVGSFCLYSYDKHIVLYNTHCP